MALPTAKINNDPGLMGPKYDFAEELPLPGNINVRRGDSLESVINAVKGAAFYTDMIGFGEASNSLTASMDTKPYPLGINYFLRTGLRCGNGADMWYYVSGIPTGNSLGPKVKKALASTGLPGLRGLAPGILEDAQDALNPVPIFNALVGSGYPKCKKVTLPVGDVKGRTQSEDGSSWIVGPLDSSSGPPMQTRWVQDTDKKGNPLYLTQVEFDAEPKLFCRDGSAIAAAPNGSCTEGFTSYPCPCSLKERGEVSEEIKRKIKYPVEGLIVTLAYVGLAAFIIGRRIL